MVHSMTAGLIIGGLWFLVLAAHTAVAIPYFFEDYGWGYPLMFGWYVFIGGIRHRMRFSSGEDTAAVGAGGLALTLGWVCFLIASIIYHGNWLMELLPDNWELPALALMMVTNLFLPVFFLHWTTYGANIPNKR